MATPSSQPPTECWECRRKTSDVRYDTMVQQHRCNACWSKADPRHLSVADPEKLSEGEKRKGLN